ncbi:MAG: XdhC family protein [Anaerolineae bacterium]|nr:XdhC family protein [Anaerolineae bacterium]
MVKEDQAVFKAALDAQNEGRSAALVTIVETQGSVPRQAGSKMLVRPDETIVGTVGGGQMEALVIQEAVAAMGDGSSRLLVYDLNDLAAGDPGLCGGTVRVFVEPLMPPPTVLVIGCGHVGKAVAELAKWMQFRVIVSDDRPGYASADQIPGMDAYIGESPAALPACANINRQTYIVAVTRGLIVDQELIPALLGTEAPYIGLIGSRRRWALTAQALQERGIDKADLARVHAPIGLELHAETPKEIAISIMAEVVMTMRGGTGEVMQWLGPPPDEETIDRQSS